MTPERAREVIRAQANWPYWGNYSKFMTPDEIAAVQERWRNHPSGATTFASIVHRISRADMFDAPPLFDEKDAAIVRERLALWNTRTGPRVGDWIEMRDGTLRRFTYHWGDGLQTTCGNGDSGSFYLHSGGGLDYSGSLDPTIPLAAIRPTVDARNGCAWIFHHAMSGAGRGVDFTIPCRVFRQVINEG